MKTIRLVNGLLLALLVTGGVAAAKDSGDTAQEQRLDAARLLLQEGEPGEAITNELNPVISYYEGIYSNGSRKIYCARTPAEKSAYLAESGSEMQEAIVLGPQYSKAHYLKSYALIELGLTSDARTNLASALKLSPFNSDYLNELAFLYQGEKNWAESQKLFMRAEDCARKYSPEDVRGSELSRALRGHGFCLVEQGQLDEAEAIYRECLKVNANDKTAANEIEYIQDQKIFQAVNISPGLIAEMAMLDSLSPMGGIEKVSQTNYDLLIDSGGMEVMLAAAMKGDVPAQFNLGLIYGNGIGVSQDYAEAAKWFRMAAEQGHARAQYGLGVMYAEGLGVTKDGAEAAKWFRPSAEKGDARGEFGLGMAYAEGIGLPKDDVEAAKWLLKSAKQGDASAQQNLGVLLVRGEGVKSDTGEWVQWHQKAAEQGNPKAETIIGYLYSGGVYFPKDPVESVKWYRRAAEQGESFAQMALGWAYASGEGVDQDYAEAANWLRKAAEKGQVKAQSNLGSMYCNGFGVSQDYAEGLKWYNKAAEEGSGDALFYIGTMYSRGDGVRQDYAEAMKWYRKAAEQGNVDALFSVGLMYFRGDGVPQDNGRSMRWIQAAAERGHPKAQEIVQGMNEK